LNFRDKDDFPIADLKGVVVNALAPGAAILKRERQIQEDAQRKRKKRGGRQETCKAFREMT
jgi:hypothetical protein